MRHNLTQPYNIFYVAAFLRRFMITNITVHVALALCAWCNQLTGNQLYVHVHSTPDLRMDGWAAIHPRRSTMALR